MTNTNNRNNDPIMPEDALDQIARIRLELDRIDASILEQVALRQQVGSKIYSYKSALGLPVADPARDVLKVVTVTSAEDQNIALAQASVQRSLLRTNRQMQFDQALAEDTGWLLGHALKKAGLKAKKEVNQAKVVAVLSTRAGSHSEAAQRLYPRASVVPARTIDTALTYVKQGAVDLAILPVNNPAVGCMSDLASLIKDSGLYIVSDITYPQYKRILVVPGGKLGNIRRVMGTAKHLMESAKLIKKMGWKTEEVAHAGVATRLVSELKDPTVAALAAVGSGEMYNLEVIDTEVSKHPAHQSRFLAVGRELESSAEANCLSMIVRLTHQSGALSEVLSVFADRNVNLKQVYSMSVEGKPWEYEVYLEVLAKPEDQNLMAILYEMDHSEDKDLHFLGWYQTRNLQE